MDRKLSAVQLNKLKAEKNYYMVGVMSDTPFSDKPVIVTNSVDVKINIKTYTEDCDIIEYINNNFLPDLKEYYMGFDKYFPDQELMPLDADERAAYISDKYKDKLIIFRPKVSIKTSPTDVKAFKNIVNVKVIDNPFKGEDIRYLKRIPIVNMKPDAFIKKLINKEYIEFTDYPTELDHLQYVLCDGFLFKFGFQDWAKHVTKSTCWRYVGLEFGIKVSDFRALDYKNIIVGGTTFIPEQYLDAVEYIDYAQMNFTRGDIIDESKESVCQVTKSPTAQSVESNIVTEKVEEDFEEIKFVTALHSYCNSKHLSYYLSDLLNFHTCVKTNYLTILAGPAGTGKSALAQAYAHMLDTSEANRNLLFLPISPSYLEPADVFGYLDKSSHTYVKSATGLVDFLLEAESNPDKLFIAILEEMNLSQIELWFAPLLSILERDEDDRYLQLFEDTADIIPSCKVPSKIKIGSNIRFIGTINRDETTKSLSDRLLDRVSLVTLAQTRFSDLKKLDTQMGDSTNTVVEKDTYDEWVKNVNIVDVFDDTELNFFSTLQDQLMEISSCKTISFRALKAGANYIANLPTGGCITREDAIDLFILQRVMSKLSGTEMVPNSLGRSYDEVKDSCMLLKLFKSEEFSAVSSFKRTIEYIERQLKEVCLYGFNF